MGTKAQKMLKIDVDKVVTLLNKAFADEWLAYYQYWVGAKVARGPLRGAVVAELDQHAGDELRHAGMLTARIIQLGGTPILEPKEWYKMSNCGYDAPTDPSVKALLKQNIKGEQCAIEVYSKIMEATEGKDIVTYNLALSILQDEIEHEDDLEAIMADLKEVK